MKSKESTHVLLGEEKGKSLDMFLLRKGTIIMIDKFRYGMVILEKFAHLHLVYHFTVPLRNPNKLYTTFIFYFLVITFTLYC